MPETSLEAINYFADPDPCLAFLVAQRWPDGNVACPQCGSTDVTFLANQRRWKCRTKHTRQQFSIKVGTIFEDSPIPLEKWLPALWMLVNDENGISSYEVARGLGVTQKTAWFMMHRLRLALERGSLTKLRGRVEANETFIGGKAHNMHRSKKLRVIGSKRGGTYSKAIVMGMLKRESGQVRARIIDNVEGTTLKRVVRENIDPSAELITDSACGYRGLSAEFLHNVVNHMKEYVRGHVHTNGMENFWALLKRRIKGTYVNVEPFHLHRYVEEQAFRYSRKRTNAGRFMEALREIVGRRLTCKSLTRATATT